jgi:hypothetical protein
MQQTGKLADRDEGSQAGSYRKVGRKPDGQGNRQTDRKTTRQVGSKQQWSCLLEQ